MNAVDEKRRAARGRKKDLVMEMAASPTAMANITLHTGAHNCVLREEHRLRAEAAPRLPKTIIMMASEGNGKEGEEEEVLHGESHGLLARSYFAIREMHDKERLSVAGMEMRISESPLAAAGFRFLAVRPANR